MDVDKQAKDWFKDWFDSPYYHLLYQNRDLREAELFISKLVAHLGLKPGQEVLDLACGKGRHALMLNKLGLNVTGLDLAEKSILEAAKLENENLHFLVHDMRFPLPEKKFDVVFNLFTSFGYFDDEKENTQVLEAVRSMLNPNGILVIDFMNVRKVIDKLVTSETKSCSAMSFFIKRHFDGKHIFKEISFEDEGKKYRFRERVQAISFRLFSELLKQSGFKLTGQFGSYQLDAFDEEHSDRLILIAVKQ